MSNWLLFFVILQPDNINKISKHNKSCSWCFKEADKTMIYFRQVEYIQEI